MVPRRQFFIFLILSPISEFISKFRDSPPISRIRDDAAVGLTFVPFLTTHRP